MIARSLKDPGEVDQVCAWSLPYIREQHCPSAFPIRPGTPVATTACL